jgi:ABC-type nitrate/sulfonate/bicarbonate transport system ATPase subunit
MTSPHTPLDRQTAHRINPFISAFWTEETLESLALVTHDLGYIIAAKEQQPDMISMKQMYLMMGTIAAALEYEAHNPCMQNRKIPNLKAV